MLTTVALVAVSAGVGFAAGHHPEAAKAARAASSLAPVASLGGTAAPTHDGSVPETADTLSQEKLRDEEASPTF